ncbi:MAG: hypothetical protein HN390_06805 [Anaerolineae bacterium]|jgi:hypothetical protein|nr:hypothetical protein [Anaerolineae bacterium]MBT7189830.1 hypothetical protein [Anaerolineae bacterium]MBT7988883.1 hypothetical protein [Anaerolineae bacterium]
MKNSTDKFIELMENKYGSPKKVGRGNVLDFGGQIVLAIGNSKKHQRDNFFYGIQTDFLSGKFSGQGKVGEFAALICGDENTVAIIPYELLSKVMENSPTNRVNIELRQGKYLFRVTGTPLLDITEHVNNYPETKEFDEAPSKEKDKEIEKKASPVEIRKHTQIQWMLMQFGLAAGYSVWTPKADQSQEYDNNRFSEISITELPTFGFDANTRKIISNIDVLWIDGNVIHRAFEIESTTSIYSGLLRMSDLVTAQPNINIDLHIVASSKRRNVVRNQILRPTFSHLRSKCSYISFEEVINKYDMVKSLISQQKTVIRGLLESESF